MKHFKTGLLLVFLTLTNHVTIYGQQDSSYFTSYAKLLTGRFFFSQKFTAFKVENTKEHYTLDYQPNTTLNMGLGVTYKWATLNIAYGFDFLNPDIEKGKTQYLDLQFHGYDKKFTLDVLGQFYKGFYLSPKGTGTTPDHYYIRPDMKVNIVGGTFQYVLNYRRFSLRASYLQTDWQKKSAGSFLVGVEVYSGRVKADSSLTPGSINRDVADLNLTKSSFVEFGPNVGYAYTLVIHKNFFLTGSASASFDYGLNTLTNDSGTNHTQGVSTNVFSRLIAGYNSARWAFSVIYINNSVRMAGTSNNHELTLNTGNVRMCFVHRFVPGSHEKKFLNIIK